MSVSKLLKLTLSLVALFFVLYFSPGCAKKTVQYVYRDTTIIRDTTIVDSGFDKQIQFYFPILFSNQTITPEITLGRINKFNKHNYIGVDSIIFMANPSVIGDTSNYSIVTLYDLTDSVLIAGSTVSNNVHDNQSTYVQSGNIYNALPDKEITLAATIRSKRDVSGTGNVAQVTNGYLILYRK